MDVKTSLINERRIKDQTQGVWTEKTKSLVRKRKTCQETLGLTEKTSSIDWRNHGTIWLKIVWFAQKENLIRLSYSGAVSILRSPSIDLTWSRGIIGKVQVTWTTDSKTKTKLGTT